MMQQILRTALTLLLTLAWLPAHAEQFTVAAASSLRYALDEIATEYQRHNPAAQFEIVYGSSGKLSTQIMNGAPFDVFLSADTGFPQQLQAAGFSAGDPAVYAIGRIVLWSSTLDASTLSLATLGTDPRIKRLAIAQPQHAPYGMRAREALQAAGSWDAVQARLVFGENISQAAQMVASGAADAGIISLALTRSPALSAHPYQLIDAGLHQPLAQAGIVTRRGGDNPAALNFMRFIRSDAARTILQRYGFDLPFGSE